MLHDGIARGSGAPAARIKHPGREDQKAGADNSGDQIAQPVRAADLDAELAEQPTRQRSADHTEDDVGDHAHVAAGDDLGKPSGNAADYNGADPTDLSVVHGILS